MIAYLEKYGQVVLKDNLGTGGRDVYLVKAKAELENTRPYFNMIETEIRRIFQSKKNIKSKYFYPEEGRHAAENYAYLVVTADKGLAGAYNHNVLKMAEEALAKHKKVDLYVVGEYGRHYFTKHKIPIKQSFTLHRIRHSRERERSHISCLKSMTADVLMRSVSSTVIWRTSSSRS